MNNPTDIDLDQVLVSDDEFASDNSDGERLEPMYFRNRLSSQGGALTPEERQMARRIFDPDDNFIEAIRSALG